MGNLQDGIVAKQVLEPRSSVIFILDFEFFFSITPIKNVVSILSSWRFYYLSPSVCSNNCLSSGLESRPGNCPCAPVAQGSGVLVTVGRKFPIGKSAGRNASELISSLVSDYYEDADPVDGWGRPMFASQDNGSGLRDLPG